jgi:perosamine synthetase
MPAEIPFGQPSFSDAEIEAVARVMRSGWVGMGPETLAFEAELADYVGCAAVVTTNSCTSALHLSLLALGVGPGDEVIVPSLTWCSTANAVLYVGARPVFADIDPMTLGLDANSVASVTTSRTRALIPVHFGGLGLDVAALAAALPADTALVEDAAHALGARLPDGSMVGASGNPTCFSFYANKVLSTGDGGAVALADTELAVRMRALRLHGQAHDAWQRYLHPSLALVSPQIAEVGLKANYTDLQAAIGRVQLRRQDEFAAARATVAQIYGEGLAGLDLCLQTGWDRPGHARHLFTIQLPAQRAGDRDGLIASLRSQGIGASLHYQPLHTMPRYAELALGRALPQTESVGARILTLPIGPRMQAEDARRVVQAVRQVLGFPPFERPAEAVQLPRDSSVS